MKSIIMNFNKKKLIILNRNSIFEVKPNLIIKFKSNNSELSIKINNRFENRPSLIISEIFSIIY